MFCKYCGAEMQDDDVFCRKCGRAVENGVNVSNSNNVNSNFSTDANAINSNPNKIQLSLSGAVIIGIVIVAVIAIIILSVMIIKGDNNEVNNQANVNQVNIGTTSQNQTTTTTTDDDEMAWNSSGYINNGGSTSNNNNGNNTSNTTVSGTSSFITTYEGVKVSFMIPDSLQIDEEFSDSSSKCIESKYRDNEVVIWIEEEYETIEEYFEGVKDSYEYRLEDPEYSNVKMSEKEQIEINGNIFYRVNLEYALGETQFKDAHIVHELGEDSLYVIEIEEYNYLTDAELKDLLTITVSK